MSRPRLISDATADHLLAGGEVDDLAVQDLAQVLAAASAPGRAEELIREDAALAAFATAHLTPTPAHRRRPMNSVLTSALGLKLAAAALAAVAAGGLAYAASTGVLPTPTNSAPAPHTSGSDGTTPSGPVRPSLSPDWSPKGGKSADPHLTGLCNAYLNAGSPEDAKNHLTADLIAAAGTEDRVKDYCLGVVSSPNPKPTAKPSPSSHKPTVSPTPRSEHSRRATRPSVLPSDR